MSGLLETAHKFVFIWLKVHLYQQKVNWSYQCRHRKYVLCAGMIGNGMTKRPDKIRTSLRMPVGRRTCSSNMNKTIIMQMKIQFQLRFYTTKLKVYE